MQPVTSMSNESRFLARQRTKIEMRTDKDLERATLSYFHELDRGHMIEEQKTALKRLAMASQIQPTDQVKSVRISDEPTVRDIL